MDEQKVLQLKKECKELARSVSTRPGFAKLLLGVNAYLIEAIATHPLAVQKLTTAKSALTRFSAYKATRVHRNA